jgi:hypothetical protein
MNTPLDDLTRLRADLVLSRRAHAQAALEAEEGRDARLAELGQVQMHIESVDRAIADEGRIASERSAHDAVLASQVPRERLTRVELLERERREAGPRGT